MGEQLWGKVEPQILRMTSGLAGGIGCSHEEMCGALTGGVLILGALYGRTSPEEDDEECNRRVCAYRERFIEAFGTARCADLQASGYGSEGQWPCSLLVERAVRILWEVMTEDA